MFTNLCKHPVYTKDPVYTKNATKAAPIPTEDKSHHTGAGGNIAIFAIVSLLCVLVAGMLAQKIYRSQCDKTNANVNISGHADLDEDGMTFHEDPHEYEDDKHHHGDLVRPARKSMTHDKRRSHHGDRDNKPLLDDGDDYTVHSTMTIDPNVKPRMSTKAQKALEDFEVETSRPRGQSRHWGKLAAASKLTNIAPAHKMSARAKKMLENVGGENHGGHLTHEAAALVEMEEVVPERAQLSIAAQQLLEELDL